MTEGVQGPAIDPFPKKSADLGKCHGLTYRKNHPEAPIDADGELGSYLYDFFHDGGLASGFFYDGFNDKLVAKSGALNKRNDFVQQREDLYEAQRGGDAEAAKFMHPEVEKMLAAVISKWKVDGCKKGVFGV